MSWIVAVSIGGGLLTLAGVWRGILLPVWRKGGHIAERWGGVVDNLAGRNSFRDPATGKLVEAIPSIGERFTSIEDKLDKVANVNQRLDTHEALLGEHSALLSGLLANTYDTAAEKHLRAEELRRADVIEAEED